MTDENAGLDAGEPSSDEQVVPPTEDRDASGPVPEPETSTDPGLTGRLRALRLDEPGERASDEPMWGFERREHVSQDDSEPSHAEEDAAPAAEEPDAAPAAEEDAAPAAEEDAAPAAEEPDAGGLIVPVVLGKGSELPDDAQARMLESEIEAPSVQELVEEPELLDDEQLGGQPLFPQSSQSVAPPGEPVSEPLLELTEEPTEPAEPAEPMGERFADDAEGLPVEPDAEPSVSERDLGSDEAAGDEAATAAAATVPAASVPAEAPLPREIDLGPERRSRWWVWALVVVGVLCLAGAGGYIWWWSSSRTVTVPDVTGKRPAEATQLLNDEGLRLGNVSEAATTTAPPGTVVVQTPPAGTAGRLGDKVTLTVAVAPDVVTVPDLSVTTVDDAEKTLARVRLRSRIVRSYSATVAVDSVIAHVPVGGEELPAGSTVAVVVSRGPQPASVTVPKVTGLNETEAVRLVNASDLRAVVYRTADASASAGSVTDQSPAARVAVAPQATVQILVSQGRRAAPLTVPRVVGMSREAATKAVKDAKLASSVRVVVSRTVPKGRVISQMPSGGTKAATDGVVGLLVSAGDSASVPVPSLVGTDAAGAERAIEGASLTAVVVEVEIVGREPGRVFAQFPSSGAQYQRSYPVIVLVAKQPGL